jgi:glycosyltransferase involved in cell wall biosynthesis
MHRAQQLGHETRILTSEYREDPRRSEEDPDVHRTLRWYWDLERYEFPHLNLAQRLRLERHNAGELRRHLELFRPHVITWWSMGCMSLSMIEQARRAGLPAVFVVHDDWLVYGWEHDRWMRTWSGPRRSVVGRLVEPVCRIPVRVEVNDAGAFVFNSHYTLERARRAGISSSSMTIVHPGIDDRFQKQVPPTPWRWRLAYVGRIDRQKGIDTAVAALEHLPPESTLTVWGTGDESYVSELKSLAARIGAGDRVRFEGFAEGERLKAAYADADAVVFPVRWNEPFGLVPLEAMGVGRPVVTTSRGGTAEFVRDGENALAFDADDAGGLAACVRRLAADELLRHRLLAGGRRTAGRFSEAEFAERTVEEIVRVLERPAAAASPAGARA